MYVVRLQHETVTQMDMRTLEVEHVPVVYAKLMWEAEGEPSHHAATGARYEWSKKTAKWADARARDKGLDLKVKYDSFLKKHKERHEVVMDKKQRDDRAAKKLAWEQRQRERDAAQDMLAALRAAEQWIAAELAGRLEVEALATVRAAIAKAENRS